MTAILLDSLTVSKHTGNDSSSHTNNVDLVYFCLIFGSIHKPYNFKSHFDSDFDDDSDDDDDDIDLSKCTVTGRQGQSVEYSCPASSPCTTITAKADLNGRVYSVSKRTKTPCKN